MPIELPHPSDLPTLFRDEIIPSLVALRRLLDRPDLTRRKLEEALSAELGILGASVETAAEKIAAFVVPGSPGSGANESPPIVVREPITITIENTTPGESWEYRG